jgi:hypothetical protein
MSKIDEAKDRLENATDLDPSKYRYGFFCRDAWRGGAGAFQWYESEDQALFAIKNDLIGLLSSDDESTADDALVSIATLIDESVTSLSEITLKDLNECLIPVQQRIDFIGTFEQLCTADKDFEKELRQQFRESELEFDDLDVLMPEELHSPIEKTDLEEFTVWVKEYCQY